MVGISISQMTDKTPLDGTDLFEIAALSTTVTITATTISAAASDNSFNDSGSGFVTAGFTVGDRVRVTGFTGNVANNIMSGVLTAVAAGKLTIGGTDGDVIVDDAAGESVTITKWVTRRATVQDITDLFAAPPGLWAWHLEWSPIDNEPPSTNYATLDLRNGRPVLDFDTTTQEAAIFTGVLPSDYAGGGVTVTLWCALTSATSGTVGWDVAFERTQASTDDIDSDSFATAQTVTAVTVPGTSGQVLKMSVNISDGANMDSLAAGDLFRIRVRRDVVNDTATGDAELLRVAMVEQ
jgi:hypothetical protein